MKNFSNNKILIATSFASIAALLLLSCSSGGGGGGSSAVSSTLNEESIQVLSQSIVDEGDCVAVSGLTLAQPLDKESSNNRVDSDTSTIQFRSYPISYTVHGLLGGSVSKEGEHDDGSNSLVYTFNDFTNPSGELKFGVNGQASVVDHGKPGDFGPIMSNKTIDTKGKMQVVKSSYNRSSSATYEVELDGYNQIYSTVLFDQDDLKIKSASARNTATDAEYKVDDLTAKGYFTDSQVALTDVKTIYTDPQVGTVEVTSDLIRISRDSMQIPSAADGTLVMTATDGTQAELVITESGNIKVYTKDNDQRVLVTEVDCSNLVH